MNQDRISHQSPLMISTDTTSMMDSSSEFITTYLHYQ